MDSQLYNWRRSSQRSRRFSVHAPRSRIASRWLLVSLGINIFLVSALIWLGRDRLPVNFSFSSAAASENNPPYLPTPPSQWINPNPDGPDHSEGSSEGETHLGPKHRWTYQEWVAQLEREAIAAANSAPPNLSILLGDSISLWFPYELLPPGVTWLNQGISGEGSAGLLRRLDLIADTEPRVMYLMIGINDLIREVSDDTVLANHRIIIQELKQMHPDVPIVVQTILPHAGDRSTWEGKAQLLAVPNERIQQLNQQLAEMAEEEDVSYLDLQPLFSDAVGNLRLDLTTDGLHLSDNGYRVWASALQLHRQLILEDLIKPIELEGDG
ncbi:MAG: SGNH/GDSL hydrolase family protein [Leptolyngbyaceae cyanobacterium]